MSKLPERLPLPSGYACVDCIHLERCQRLQVSYATRRECAFWPSRFRLGRAAAAEVETDSYYPRHASLRVSP